MQSYRPPRKQSYSQLYRHRNRGFTIPLYDLCTIVAGFYIGYNEGKGMDVGTTVEYLTKYGPTTFALCMTPIILKANNMLGRWINRRSIHNLQHGDFEVTLNGETKKYKDMNKLQRQEIASSIITNVNNLESKLQEQKYLKPTLIAGTKAAIGTMIGYAAGRLYSQIN